MPWIYPFHIAKLLLKTTLNRVPPTLSPTHIHSSEPKKKKKNLTHVLCNLYLLPTRTGQAWGQLVVLRKGSQAFLPISFSERILGVATIREAFFRAVGA